MVVIHLGTAELAAVLGTLTAVTLIVLVLTSKRKP